MRQQFDKGQPGIQFAVAEGLIRYVRRASKIRTKHWHNVTYFFVFLSSWLCALSTPCTERNAYRTRIYFYFCWTHGSHRCGVGKEYFLYAIFWTCSRVTEYEYDMIQIVLNWVCTGITLNLVPEPKKKKWIDLCSEQWNPTGRKRDRRCTDWYEESRVQNWVFAW